jgi:hypothetical protein
MDEIVRSIAPSTIFCFELQLAKPLVTDGEHALTATWFDVSANELAVRGGTFVAVQAPPAS